MANLSTTRACNWGGGTRSDCSRQQSELCSPPVRWAPGIKLLMSCRLEGQQHVINQELWLMSLVLTFPSQPRALAPYIPCAHSLSLYCPPFSTCACVPSFVIKKATFCSAGIKPVDSIQAEPALNGPSAPSTLPAPRQGSSKFEVPTQGPSPLLPNVRGGLAPSPAASLRAQAPDAPTQLHAPLLAAGDTRGSSTRRGWQCPACSHCWRSTARAQISAHREGFAA